MSLKDLLDSVDFKYLPLRDGYAVEQSSSPVVSAQTSGGAPRVRLDFPEVSFIASVQYWLKFKSDPLQQYPKNSYDDFMNFFERYRRNPTAFSALLVLDPIVEPDKLKAYMVNVVPGSFNMSGFSRSGARATLQLEAILPIESVQT